MGQRCPCGVAEKPRTRPQQQQGRSAATGPTGAATGAATQQQASPRSLLRAQADPYVPSPKGPMRSGSPLRAGAAPFRGGQPRGESPLRAAAKPYEPGQQRRSPLRADAKPFVSPGQPRSRSPPLRADAKPYSSPRHQRPPPQQPGQETWIDLTQHQQPSPGMNASAPAFKPTHAAMLDDPAIAGMGMSPGRSGGARAGGDPRAIATHVAVLDDPATAGVYRSSGS